MKLQDYYEILGVGRDATADALKRAYRALVLRWHPDRHAGAARDRAVSRFKEITEAYDVLSDPLRRREHDALLGDEELTPDRGGMGLDRGAAEEFDEGFGDFFSTVYGGFEPGVGTGGRGPYRARGRDVEAECSLTVGQVLEGGMAQLEVPVRAECASCLGDGLTVERDVGRAGRERSGSGRAGSGRSDSERAESERICAECDGNGWVAESRTVEVSIPEDAYDGMELRLDGLGGDGAFGGEAGDLRVTLRIRSDRRYAVSGPDLCGELPIAPWEAVDGARVDVVAPTGTLRVTVPAGTRSGSRLRVAGNGLRTPDGGRGDLYLVVRIDLPRELTERQKHLLQELRRAGSTAISGGVRAPT